MNGIFYTGVVENRRDPSRLGRCQVRIVGLHTENKKLIPTEELPWAYPIQPIISAAMNGIGYTPLGPVEGTWVVGFFRDGENCQEPVIMGTLGGIPQEAPNSRIGFNDPSEKYPISEFLEEADTNRLARNEKISETIVQAKIDNLDKDVPVALGADENWDEPNPFYSAEYPFNHVRFSESGHVMEVDDTLNHERLGEYHRKGTFYEIGPDGKKITKVVNDNYLIIAGGDYVHIKGVCNVTVGGDCNLKVNGGVNLEAVHDSVLNFGSDLQIDVGGKLTINVTEELSANAKSMDLLSKVKDVKVSSVGNIELNADGVSQVQGTLGASLLSPANATVNSTGKTDIQGSSVGIKGVKTEISGSATCDVSSIGVTTITGSTVELNPPA